MRLPTRSFLTTILLAGAVGLVLVASLQGNPGLFTGAVVFLVLAAALNLLRADRNAPGEQDTQAFVAGLLGGRGYAGAYRIRGFTQVVSPGIEPGHVRVKFRGELVFHEPLYQLAAPPVEAFAGVSPRRIEWMRRTAEMLERELGSDARGVAGRAPLNPYDATFLVVRKSGGWSMEFTGTAWAVLQGGQWRWDLQNLSQSIDSLVLQGKPLDAFPGAVVLGTPEGKAWLKGAVAAWQEYEKEITALQQGIEQARAARAREVMGGFFRDIQAGTTYHGSGESLTGQVAAARYFLEFVSADAATGRVAFTLRSDRRWAAARAFAGTVVCDPATSAVTVHALTTPADAQPDAGPLLSVSAGFEIELRWFPGSPARLEGTTIDLMLRLAEVSSEKLSEVLNQAHAREREIAAAIAPGGVYRGSVTIAGREEPIRLEFLPATDFATAAARLERGEWSGMFRALTSGEAIEGGCDVVLESTVRAAPSKAPADAAAPLPGPESWSRVLLTLDSGQFSGTIISGEQRLQVTQLTPTPPSKS